MIARGKIENSFKVVFASGVLFSRSHLIEISHVTSKKGWTDCVFWPYLKKYPSWKCVTHRDSILVVAISWSVKLQ